MWGVLRALAPWIRCGLVQVFGIDPKGGMELGRAEGLFQNPPKNPSGTSAEACPVAPPRRTTASMDTALPPVAVAPTTIAPAQTSQVPCPAASATSRAP